MKVLKEAGTFTVLDEPEHLRRQLLKIELAGRTCYQSEGARDAGSAVRFARMLLRRGHHSVLEHSLMTVRFSGHSRGFTHELVRHRLTSVSQESTRYVDYSQRGAETTDLQNFHLHCVTPPHLDEKKKLPIQLSHETGERITFSQMLANIEAYYQCLRLNGWSPEDARQILPIATRSEIVVSANFREWRHIFKMRTSKYAHWEIRRTMCNLVEKVQELVPVVFDDFETGGSDKNGLRYFVQNPETWKE